MLSRKDILTWIEEHPIFPDEKIDEDPIGRATGEAVEQTTPAEVTCIEAGSKGAAATLSQERFELFGKRLPLDPRPHGTGKQLGRRQVPVVLLSE